MDDLPKKGVVYSMTIFLILIVFLLAILFVITSSSKIKTFTFVLGFIIIIFGSVYIYTTLTSVHIRFRRKLHSVRKLLRYSSIKQIKKEYAVVHRLYGKLSSKHKRKFESPLHSIHEKIEEMIVAEKKIQELAQDISNHTLKKQKELFHELNDLYKKLPEETKEKYYHVLIYLRRHLEHGK